MENLIGMLLCKKQIFLPFMLLICTSKYFFNEYFTNAKLFLFKDAQREEDLAKQEREIIESLEREEKEKQKKQGKLYLFNAIVKMIEYT